MIPHRSTPSHESPDTGIAGHDLSRSVSSQTTTDRVSQPSTSLNEVVAQTSRSRSTHKTSIFRSFQRHSLHSSAFSSTASLILERTAKGWTYTPSSSPSPSGIIKNYSHHDRSPTNHHNDTSNDEHRSASIYFRQRAVRQLAVRCPRISAPAVLRKRDKGKAYQHLDHWSSGGGRFGFQSACSTLKHCIAGERQTSPSSCSCSRRWPSHCQ